MGLHLASMYCGSILGHAFLCLRANLVASSACDAAFEDGDALAQMIVSQMGIAHGHADVLMAGESRDFRQRDSCLNESTNEAMA